MTCGAACVLGIPTAAVERTREKDEERKIERLIAWEAKKEVNSCRRNERERGGLFTSE